MPLPIETWGEGTNQVVETCRAQGYPNPEFVNEAGVAAVAGTGHKTPSHASRVKAFGARASRGRSHVDQRAPQRRAHHRDKQLDLDPLAGVRVRDRRLLAGVADEALLARLVDLAHHDPQHVRRRGALYSAPWRPFRGALSTGAAARRCRRRR